MITLLVIAIILNRNHLLSLMAFLICLVWHQLIHPVINGGDLVLLTFMFVGIFCNQRPKASKGTALGVLQETTVSFSLLIGQIIIATVYLVSGYDKLISLAWRDGTAIYGLINVDFYATGWMQKLAEEFSLTTLVVISWSVILFEILFPVLVWFKRFRYPVLVTGLFFHLIIALGLSLPDFATVMVWSYVLFVSDEDFCKIANKLRNISFGKLVGE
jgi:hypothetical protein